MNAGDQRKVVCHQRHVIACNRWAPSEKRTEACKSLMAWMSVGELTSSRAFRVPRPELSLHVAPRDRKRLDLGLGRAAAP